MLASCAHRATGGSAPLEAIQLDEAQAESWRKRFAKDVIADAKARGLLRGRWTRVDWIVFGVLTAAVLRRSPAASSCACVEDKGKGEQRRIRLREDAGSSSRSSLAWLIMAACSAGCGRSAIRAAGEAAAARWLGVKRFLQHDQRSATRRRPASRSGTGCSPTARGSASRTARSAAIPLEVEDPDVAWSRVGGDWHQVHVEYPTRFGYGQRPRHVLLNGALRTLLWGVLAFVVLPIVADAGVEHRVRRVRRRCNDAATFGFVALGVAIFGGDRACTCSCASPTA